ncbi:SOS response-associated peptidase [Aromatoleum evansii]|jgi:putative SOS response-associated peptidase YedK|uniref:SOS response-associated peptidase n=1 Tax=Aromatoleum evansii TaxID=59406 RepID=UPI00145D6041|nr:SOS response-associated peptidase [Aromatoleum evansii]NMG29614.1 SOS response-associated peptidase [Aromatoleum evansii]
MCGRYALYGPASRIRDQFTADIDELNLPPRYNAAPLQELPIVRQRPTGERVVHLLRWGLIPSWSKDATIAHKLINARSESAPDKPSFRAAFKSRRCIVPASGFYEWKKLAGRKQPYFIHAAGEELLALAGLWERWSNPEGDTIDTFTILTTEANEAVQAMHDRMPVLLGRGDYEAWLNRETDLERVRQLLTPYPSDSIQMHPVSLRVGNVRNDDPDLVTAVVADES